MSEIWLNIDGYNGIYQVSNAGQVRSIYNGKIKLLKPYHKHKVYMTVNLWKDRGYKTYTIHRLVAISFIPNPNNHPVVNHIDGNKINNHVSNLEWCTHGDNLTHAYKNNLKPKKYGIAQTNAKYTLEQVCEMRELRKNNYTVKKISEMFGADRATISNIVNYKARLNV